MNLDRPDQRDESYAEEIAYVLFIDIVKYALLPMKEQKNVRRQLKEIALNCEEYRRASECNGIISRSTGDGLALVFFSDPTAPVRCAIEFTQELKACPNLKVRMGIHTGPVCRDTDINQQHDVSGPGINIAQRVMDFGDAGHILISRVSAEFLMQLDDWKPYVFAIGEGRDKHGEKVHVYNFHKGECGNSDSPAKLKSQPYKPPLVWPIRSVGPDTQGKSGRNDDKSESNLKAVRPKVGVKHKRYHSCGMLLPPGQDECFHCGRNS